jgi:SAM-dependent methyltransferase
MSELDLPASYSRIAAEYSSRIADELQHKPFDREQLDRLAELAEGIICDIGCGPGHVAAYLHGRGAAVLGIDISPGMVAEAQRLNPGLEFRQGSMSALDVPDETWGAIAAFYSIIHIPRDQMVATLSELKRLLRPGGYLLLAFHLGQQTVHADDMWGIPVSIDFHFLDRVEMEGWLAAAGFTIESSLERDPYPDVEHQSRRAYILAQKPLSFSS